MYNSCRRFVKHQQKSFAWRQTVPKRVILVSATPLNRPEDIANQVYLFKMAKNQRLKQNLQHFFRKEIIDHIKKLKDKQDI